MLELKTKTYCKKIDIDSRVAGKFEHPIIFYMISSDDSRRLFLTFVILDFAKRKLVYIFSNLPENIMKVNDHPDEKILRFSVMFFTPHSSIQINPEEDFCTFLENTQYFLYVNRKKNIMRIFTGKDFNNPGMNQLVKFGSTVYKDDEDAGFFYFTTVSTEKDRNRRFNVFKARLDLSEIENIFSCPSNKVHAPHVTRKYGKYLLSSDFMMRKFRNKITGKVYDGPDSFVQAVYQDLYTEYCHEENKEFSKEKFFIECNVSYGSTFFQPDFNPAFREFCGKRGKNIIKICECNKKYSFEVLSGEISLLNLENLSLTSYETTFCAPAHFEIDSKKGIIFTSSHNFASFDKIDKIYFLGPAALDRFVIENGKLKRTGVFSDPSAYRFTTHRTFYHKGKSYVCAFGQPNRLFFIDAETLEILYYDDIEEDYLSDQENIRDYLNANPLEQVRLNAIEVSPDGEILFLLGSEYIFFYSFPERKIISKIAYQSAEGIPLDLFSRFTIHSSYLD
jgi:hypothetical protein